MLSSFLLSRSSLAASGKIDSSLDAIFAASAKPLTVVDKPIEESTSVAHTSESPTATKRKRKDDHDSRKAKKQKKGQDQADALEPISSLPNAMNVEEEDTPVVQKSQSKGKKSRHEKVLQESEPSNSVDTKAEKKKKKDKNSVPDDSSVHRMEIEPSKELEDSDSEGEQNDEPLIHESLSGKGPKNSLRRKSRYVPEGETPAERDERTIFVGNLPLDIVTKKSLHKALKRHLLSCMPPPPEPSTKIESIRFRSVAFKAPTNPQALKEAGKEKRIHDKERTAAWKNAQKDDNGSGGEGEKPKVFLTPAEKKRIAFIKGDFHEQADSVNAFVVFEHQDPEKKAIHPLMSPVEAAAVVIEKMNRSKFEGRTLRLDHVGQVTDAKSKDAGSTVFVGNLDFAAKEEDLRAFFEKLLITELGPAGNADAKDDSSSEEDELSEETRSQWVHDVRIIRDEGTQLGKGFAYVHFSDKTCVDEILAMDQAKLKFAKRKLRITRYSKNGAISSKSKETAKGRGKDGKPPKSEKKVKHKGDPKLGEKLKGLSKEERKEAKKKDENRQARRLEKKMERLALEKSLTKPQKDRVRVRKMKTVSGANGKRAKGSKKSNS